MFTFDVSVYSLWAPLLLSAVLVFIASAVIHMTPLWHKRDFPRMAREPEVLAALRPLAIPPGDYFIPRAEGMKEMRTPEFKDKLAKGPVVVMTVMPNGMINMNKSLAQWFVFVLVVSGLWRWSIRARCPHTPSTRTCSRSPGSSPSWAMRSRSRNCRSGTGAPGA